MPNKELLQIKKWTKNTWRTKKEGIKFDSFPISRFKRRVDTGEARSPNYLISHPSQEMYGINFAKWEESLKAIEKENKLLVKYGEEKKRKEEKSKKLEEKKKLKEEELKEYEEYSLRVKNI